MSELVNDCLKLGFGMMRLPKDAQGAIDVETTKGMVDDFIAAGGKYFDTAFVYEGSEEATRKALVERYPRDAFYLASKLHAGKWAAKDEAAAKDEIRATLERSGAGYLDFYLLHGIEDNNIGFYNDYGIWDYMRGLKEEGLVKHVGFSFHDQPALLDKLLSAHPDVDFVMLQINYADWDNPTVRSRENYEVARAHGKPIVVMEPVKGGLLARPAEPVARVLRDANPQASLASWALRFAASLPGVMMVLSGMSTPDQMKDNLGVFRDFEPLSAAEQDTIAEARRVLASINQVQCTACHYCTPGCPLEIHIPEMFQILNEYKLYGNLERAKRDYGWRPGGHRASACIACGQCEDACPQHLPIIDLLAEVAEDFE
ncbi:MAG: aldo/keto reductase [Denitrobacterium sp.]|jgi:predicted aldo/keto reductase-like oxidoreductase|nr:aldo/keto reductase [Denitrobacterium sp.]